MFTLKILVWSVVGATLVFLVLSVRELRVEIEDLQAGVTVDKAALDRAASDNDNRLFDLQRAAEEAEFESYLERLAGGP
jgi:hypothetical protein